MRQDPSFTETSARDSNEDADIEGAVVNDQALEDYRQRYGLAVDPFGADPYFPFFTGGQRRELLDQLIHIGQFGQGIPVVAGERGVGKTRLALAVYEAMGEGNASFINAVPTMRIDMICHQAARHFGVALSAYTVTDLVRAIHSAIDAGPKLILVDNAQDLDDETLSALVRIPQSAEHELTGNDLRIALFGDISLVARVQELQPDSGVIELFLAQFSLKETVDYLNYRMEMADYLGPEIFTEANVEPWWRNAQGQLPAIHRSAQEHLLETVLPPLKSGTKPFPILHIMAIAILGGVALMTLLYSGEKDEQESTQRVPISLQPPAGVPSPIEPVPATEIPATSVPEPAPLSADFSVANSSVSAAQEQAISSEASVSSIIAEPAAVMAPVSEPPKPQVSSAASIPAEPTATGARSFTNDEQTLLSWRESDFTLQLLGVSTESAAKAYVAGQPNRDDLLIFKTIRQSKPWFVVVAGRYSSSAEARNAISTLPPEQAKAGPWSRELKGIQEEIRR